MKYKLLDDAFSKSDIAKGVKVLKSKQITMSKETKTFEKNFAKKILEKKILKKKILEKKNLEKNF